MRSFGEYFIKETDQGIEILKIMERCFDLDVDKRSTVDKHAFKYHSNINSQIFDIV